MPAMSPPAYAPMLATLAKSPPPDEERYAFETKWDGYRVICTVDRGGVRLTSRGAQDYTAGAPQLQELAGAARHRLVLDGELCAVRPDGGSDFQALPALLHGREREAGGARLAYMIFDLLWMDGRAVTGLPYTERRERLEGLSLEGASWHTPPYLLGRAAELLEASRQAGQEGVMAKLLNSPYRPGLRSREWLKLKNTQRQEFVIGGWTPGEGSRLDRIGSLLLGVYESAHADARLLYAGRVGTGFNAATLDELARLLRPLQRDGNPFATGKPPRVSRFVQPELVCEVEFWEWTRAGEVRHPSFRGLREDKRARQVVRERAV